jgi:hypothetical protein
LRSAIDADEGQNQKFCIAICGYSQSEIESLGQRLKLGVLTGDTDIVAGQIFLSDLEQTKGFEFDSVIIVNCSSNVLPHPALPTEESYRELCKLYVAMTRAKTELIVSYAKEYSPFLQGVTNKFSVADWSQHAMRTVLPGPRTKTGDLPVKRARPYAGDAESILYMPQAVGLSVTAQEKLLQLVTGTNRFTNKRQVEWKAFDQFYEDAKISGTTRNYNGISDIVWLELKSLHDKLKVVSLNEDAIETLPQKISHEQQMATTPAARRTLTLPKKPG